MTVVMSMANPDDLSPFMKLSLFLQGKPEGGSRKAAPLGLQVLRVRGRSRDDPIQPERLASTSPGPASIASAGLTPGWKRALSGRVRSNDRSCRAVGVRAFEPSNGAAFPLGWSTTGPSGRPIRLSKTNSAPITLSLASLRAWLHTPRQSKPERIMLLDSVLEDFPQEITLKDNFTCVVRPLEPADEQALHEFFLAVPDRERMFIKHRVNDPAVIHDWCQNIDLGRNLPLLAFSGSQIIGSGTLHQQLGGWKRHIGRVSVLVHQQYRGRGLARA